MVLCCVHDAIVAFVTVTSSQTPISPDLMSPSAQGKGLEMHAFRCKNKGIAINVQDTLNNIRKMMKSARNEVSTKNKLEQVHPFPFPGTLFDTLTPAEPTGNHSHASHGRWQVCESLQ